MTIQARFQTAISNYSSDCPVVGLDADLLAFGLSVGALMMDGREVWMTV